MTSSDGHTVYVGGSFASAVGVSGTNIVAHWGWTSPDLTAISPDSGLRAGTSVTIDGTSFLGASRVLVNDSPAPFAWVDDSTVTVTMRARSGNATIAVEVVGGTAYAFTVKALTGAGWAAALNPSHAVVAHVPAKPPIVITGSRDGGPIAVSGTATMFVMGGELGRGSAPQARLRSLMVVRTSL